MSPAPLGGGGSDLSLPAFKVRAFFPFQLNELPKKKTIRVETSAVPARKELSINEIIHTGGEKNNTSFSAQPRAAGQLTPPAAPGG